MTQPRPEARVDDAPGGRAERPSATNREGRGVVISKDGTKIGYHEVGSGPGLVLLHGTMESARSHLELAHALEEAYTVYLPDRRGRGLSGPYRADHRIGRDVEDLDALLAATGARSVLGVSSGGLICLEAALTTPRIRKLAVFEPPLIVNGSPSTSWLARFDDEMARGELSAALVTGMLGTRMGPPLLHAMPRWFLEWLTTMMLRHEERKATREDMTMRMLAPTLRFDVQLVEEMSARIEHLGAIRQETLLLGGSKSPSYLKTALDALERVVPRATRATLAGLHHGATGNRDRGGKPERVARELRKFLG